jgi:microcystin-dependent protein
MADLSIPNTFVSGTSISSAKVNENNDSIKNYINDRNDGATLWDNVKASSGTFTALSAPNVLPPGAIQMYGAAAAPTGFLLCDGSAVSRSTYTVLFSVIGTTFGAGDTTTTFNVPDMRGVFPKGAGTTSRTLGKDSSGNFYAGVLGTYLTDKLQGHIHNVVNNVSTGGALNGTSFTSTAAVFGYDFSGNGFLTIGGPTDDGTNGAPRTGHTTEPQSLGLSYIIKY